MQIIEYDILPICLFLLEIGGFFTFLLYIKKGWNASNKKNAHIFIVCYASVKPSEKYVDFGS